MKTEAIPAKTNSMLHKPGMRLQQARQLVPASRSLDLEVDRGFFPAIAPDLVFDGLNHFTVPLGIYHLPIDHVQYGSRAISTRMSIPTDRPAWPLPRYAHSPRKAAESILPSSHEPP